MTNIKQYTTILFIIVFIEKQAGDAYLVLDDATEFRDVHAALLHAVALAQGYGIVLQSLLIHGYAEGAADCVHTAVALANLVLLLVLAVEVEAQVVHNLLCLLGHTVLLGQGEYGQLDGSQCCGQVQDGTCLSVGQLLLFVAVAHDGEEHAVYADRGLDNVWSV